MPFTFYGVYDVRLELEGYEPKWTQARARAPWWDHPGPDLVAEAIPGMRSDVTWDFDLKAAPDAVEVDEEAMLERADELRERSGEAPDA